MRTKPKQASAVAVLALAAAFGVSSCATYSPTPGELPDELGQAFTDAPMSQAQAEMPAWWNDGSVQELFGDIDVFPAEYGVPACYLPGYVYSDAPQGAHEQWIFDSYPVYWASGVRALSTSLTGAIVWEGAGNTEIVFKEFATEEEMIEFYRENPGSASGVESYPDAGPVALVQYYNGKRYEGTASMPLAFQGRDPEVPAVFDKTKMGPRIYKFSISAGDRPGGYTSDVEAGLTAPTGWNGTNSPFHHAGSGYGESPIGVKSPPLTTDEYIDWVRSGEYLIDHAQALGIPSSQVRALYPNEFLAFITLEPGTLDDSAYANEISAPYVGIGSARGIMINGAGAISTTH